MCRISSSPGGVQAHAPGQPLEDLGAELLLQVLDAAVEGGGRHVETLGRLPDGARAGDLVHVSQQADVLHGCSRSFEQ
jgi:hypothetical protein